ncbi:putative PP-loop ATPase, YdaO type [Nitrospira japonica]|uniref:Putative PP-loop ATPase, YdaO type n=1 Tax=Nitrospira japonica TaxID=1325564 RepID=A0A1W1I083_9BACT|nr:ATP-binding protein [Nitrospira japonica]SLM46394.1 putative PP-loop ATPase, YdaO type [Nitrospira japonica]
MNCTKCKTRAVIKLPRHHAAFCKDCFNGFVHDQVAKAVKSQKMFGKEARILVAVSGGKDSLALWDILLKLGYRADALYVNLGIGSYSERSHEKVRRFAEAIAAPLGAALHTHTVEQEEGAGIRELAMLVHRPTCSTCGTIKRYQFNRAAIEHEYDVMATGHNLDDEAARLLGNVLHWQEDYLDKQSPSLPASVEGFAKKVKPLYRLTERELAAYCVLNKIDYIVEECPMAQGAKTLLYKEVLNRLETESPGTKHTFYWGFLDRSRKETGSQATMEQKDRTALHPCQTCGQPTTAEICSYCKLMTRAKTPSVS